MKKYLLAATAAFFVSTPVLAADGAFAPSGFRVELRGSHDNSGLELDQDDVDGIAAAASDVLGGGAPVTSDDLAVIGIEKGLGLRSKGLSYGVAVGYDHPVSSRLSIGIEAEFVGSNAEDHVRKTTRIPYAAPSTDVLVVDWEAAIETKRSYFVGGRLSYGVVPGLNVYAKGGYTNVKYKAGLTVGAVDIDEDDEVVVDHGTFASGLSKKAGGFRVGAGAQATITGGLYLGAEFTLSEHKYDITRKQTSFVLGYRF